jgi:DNA-binding response OmpR family regulator
MAVILIVDDEFGMTEVLEAMLLDAGHKVMTAMNGRQGLERLKEAPADLVLLDFMMPVMDGPSMLRALQKDTAYRTIPVIMMSAMPEAMVAETVGGLYAAFLRKPFKIREVIAVIEAGLNKSVAKRSSTG